MSWAYLAVLDHLPTPQADDDARAAQWVPLGEVLDRLDGLAFDHAVILADALARVGLRVVPAGAQLSGHLLLKQAGALEPGDVVTREHPHYGPNWWRIDSRAGLDDAGIVHFAARCLASPDPGLIGTWALFAHPADRGVYLHPNGTPTA